ncbi:calcium/sodium antiporter [Roseicyclus elongatus]|uniref:calcium/sodium antiporter n=1 Tax=Roseicyclus elongatus TaxID=159346 RepID=UPI001FDF5B5A|nr:calcium/sodium antiporter [Roseibacterium elongatum]
MVLLAGLGLLLGGGEILVRGGLALAHRLGMTPAMIGAVVLGFGTSTPELVTSLQAAFAGAPGIALGNVVGSNIANILLILGVAALIAPMVARGAVSQRDVVAMLLATLAGLAVLASGQAGRGTGVVLLLGLAAYLWVSLRSGARVDVPADIAVPVARPPVWTGAALAIGGIAATILGAHLLVGAATRMATDLGVPEAVIGLTLVAVGTSLPELATSVVAAFRGQGAMSLGNILGSNVFNIAGILGVTAVASPLVVPASIGVVDAVTLAGSALLLAAFLWVGRIGRVAAMILLTGYLAYVGWLARAFLP